MDILSAMAPCRRPFRTTWACALLAAAFPVTVHAAAPGTAQTVAGWTVAPSKDATGCFITRTYDHPGGTTVLLGVDKDGTNRLSVLNANWSIRARDRLALDFKLAAGSYRKHFAVGIAVDGKRGFVSSFEPRFTTYFASSPTLSITRGDVPVERLALTGSGAAVKALRACVEVQRKAPKATDRAGGPTRDDIPKDPFAPSATRKSRK